MVNRPLLPDKISPFAKLLGLSFSTSENGSRQCVLQVDEKVLNVNGTVHGGALYTLADVSMGWMLHEHLREDERMATIEMKINYFVAASSGVLTAEARLIHKSRKLAVLESRIECGRRLVANAIGTFYITNRRIDGKNQH